MATVESSLGMVKNPEARLVDVERPLTKVDATIPMLKRPGVNARRKALVIARKARPIKFIRAKSTRTPTITAEEKASRSKAWNSAVSSSFLEGIIPAPQLTAIAQRYINGEFELKEAVNLMMQSLNQIESHVTQ